MCKTNLREFQDWPKCCFLNTVKCKKWIHLKINIYSVIHQFLTCWCDQIKMNYVSKHAIKASQHWTFTESETNVKSWLHVCTQLQLLFSYSYESGIVLALILSSGMKTTVWSSFIPCLPSFCTFRAAHQQSALVHSQLFIYFFCYFSLQQMDLLPESGSVGVFFLFSLHGQRLLAHIESFGSSLLNYKVLTLLCKVPWDNKSRFGTV